MMRVEITVPGVPIAQPRAKATTFGGYTRVYTPAGKVRPFKEAIRILFAEAYKGPPVEGPVMIQITAVFPRPKGMIWKSKPMPRVPHAKKPDSDNVAKSVCDALNQIAWRDDSQCYYVIVMKFIASGDEQPHTRIVITST
jgi:Holliday junction resolvase RusA-like endonuclease